MGIKNKNRRFKRLFLFLGIPPLNLKKVLKYAKINPGEYMRIKRALLLNYRNYQEEEFFFDSDLEFIVGNNAQGKTNLLEAIYLASMGKTFRGRTTREAFYDRKLPFRVELDFSQDQEDFSFVYTHRDKKPHIEVNRLKIERRSELFGRFPMVLFSPEHLNIVREGPAYRRNFLDREISLVSPSYFQNLIHYQKLLRSRNVLLRENFDETQMEVYEEKLAHYGKKLTETRESFIDRLNLSSGRLHGFMSGEKEELLLVYRSNLKELEDIKKAYREDRARDIALGYTSLGPQADDMKIFIDKKDAKRFASQGQVRIASISIFFGLLDFVETSLKKKPLVLLDDVFSELDKFRRHQLLKLLSSHQIILTGTDLDGLDLSKIENYKITTIEEGRKI